MYPRSYVSPLKSNITGRRAAGHPSSPLSPLQERDGRRVVRTGIMGDLPWDEVREDGEEGCLSEPEGLGQEVEGDSRFGGSS